MLKYGVILEGYYEAIIPEGFSSDDIVAMEAMDAKSSEENAINNGNPDMSSGTGNGTGSKINPNSNMNNTKLDKGIDAPKLIQMIQKLLDNIKALLKKATLKMANRLKHMMVTDKGFKEKLRERERTVKPLKAVKITSYQYLQPFLNSFTANLNKMMVNLFNELLKCSDPKNPIPPKSEILQQPLDKVVGAMITVVTRKDDVVDISSLFNYLQKNFRGEKKEIVYKAEQVPLLIKEAEDYGQINTQLTNNMNTVKNFIDNMSSRSNAIRTVPNITDEQRRDFLTNLNKGHRLFNAYQSILQYVYELRVEKALSYRIIVQKFYQF